MNDLEFPKFIQNVPHGIDKFEGGSADRVADAIKTHIDLFKENDKIPKIIGLDGKWGSGKSNVIRILNNNLKDSFLFEYDAWGHQEDLQRRSFIESLTTELLEKKILEGTTSIKIKSGDTRNVTWEEKLKYLLARKSEIETKSYPKIGYGIILAFITAILLPIFYFIASVNTVKTYWSIIVVAIPIIISLLIWGIAAWKNKKYRNLDFLLAIYQDKVKEEVEFETISEDEPSVSDFRKWMQDVSNAIEGKIKLIVVFDNMDRLPTDKVKELWSSIHTFFADNNGYKNIWVIIPFDKKHLANAFGGDNEEKNYEIINHFINKTFPVIYRVSPPVMTAWKKIFNEFYENAFGTTENEDKATIQRIFGILRPDFTPRDIIAFINELVSLKKTWKEEIPLLHIAIFALQKEKILESPVESILSADYIESIKKIVDNSEELEGYMASLVYGIDLDNAKQIPLTQYLRDTLKGEPKNDINEYSTHKHFIEILDVIIKDIDPAILDAAIINLSKLNSTELNITVQWNEIAKLQLTQPLTKLSLEDTHKILLTNSDDKIKATLSKYLYNEFRNHKEFKGDEFFLAMQALEDYIKKYNIKLSDFVNQKIVSPEILIDYVNQANNNYKNYKLICNNDDLNDYLIGLIVTKLPKMNFIEFLVSDESYSFEKLKSKIESAITADEINEKNYPEIVATYKLISKEKPLEQQFSSSQIQTLLNSTTDTTSESYYDLVAMELSNQLIDTSYIEGLDEKVAERIEFYKSYGDLLILSKDWGSILLRKSVKIMTEKSYGSNMTLVTILPFFEEIKEAINISPDILLNELTNWEDSIKEITIENIESLIIKYSFYEYSSKTNNKLTTHINNVAIAKIESIPVDDLYVQRNTPSYYWLNCASLLIQGSIIKKLPDNLTMFCKKIILDISAGAQAIPVSDSLIDIIIQSADKRNLQPTIKDVCVDYCNKTKIITPELFLYFAGEFDFINKVKSREGDISSIILNTIITDSSCLNFIIEDSADYIQIINNAGDDANDLKSNIRQMLHSNKSEKLKEFARAIGIKNEDENTDQ